MFSLRTSDDWTFDVQVGVPNLAGDADTYSNTATSAYDVGVAFSAWLNDAARPWSGGGYVFTADYFVDEGGVGVGISIDSDTLEIIPDATAAARMVWIADSGVRVASEGPCAGTWVPSGPCGVRGYLRAVPGGGECSGVGSVRDGVAGLALRSPTVEAMADRVQAAMLTSLLPSASNPRKAWVYQTQDQAWRLLSIAKVTYARADPLLTRVNLEAAG